MEHYLTYKKLIELIQQNLPIKIKTLSTGDLSYLGKENNPSLYPLMHIVPTQITYNENTTQFTLNILFCDIVNTDMSNEVNVISDMNLSCRDFLSQIKLGVFMDYFDTDLPNTSTTFLERFNDHLGGVELNIPVVIFEDMNACDQYEPIPSPPLSPSVTPSITPSVTSTPSITPSLTPTPTPTSSITPSLTLTPSITPSPSCTVTTQYIQPVVHDQNTVRFYLWQDEGYTIQAQAICDIDITFNITGTSSTFVSGLTTTMVVNDHQHSVNVNSELGGADLLNVEITNISLPLDCPCYNVIYPNQPEQPTPTPTSSLTPTPSITPSITLTPSISPSITPSITPTPSTSSSNSIVVFERYRRTVSGTGNRTLNINSIFPIGDPCWMRFADPPPSAGSVTMPYVSRTITNISNCFGGNGIKEWDLTRAIYRDSGGSGTYRLTQITINLYENSPTNLVSTRSVSFSPGWLITTTGLDDGTPPIIIDQLLDIQPDYPAVAGNTYYLEWVDIITRS